MWGVGGGGCGLRVTGGAWGPGGLGNWGNPCARWQVAEETLREEGKQGKKGHMKGAEQDWEPRKPSGGEGTKNFDQTDPRKGSNMCL